GGGRLPAGQRDGHVERDLQVAQDAAVGTRRGTVAPLDAPHGQRVPRLAALVFGAQPVDLITQRAGARSIDVVVLLGGDDRRAQGAGRGGPRRRCRRRGDLGGRGAARGGEGQRRDRCRAHVRATPG